MLAISAAELGATGRRSTRWFQGLLAGKIRQWGAPGTGCAATSAGTAAIARHAAMNARRHIDADDRALRDYGDASRGEPEDRLVDLSDVVAIDLEWQRALVEGLDP